MSQPEMREKKPSEAEMAFEKLLKRPIPNSIPQLEMEIEELQDQRRLLEGKTGSGNTGCASLLIIGSLIVFALALWPLGLIGLVVGILMLNTANKQKEASEQVKKLDAKIKKLRKRIVELKEASSA